MIKQLRRSYALAAVLVVVAPQNALCRRTFLALFGTRLKPLGVALSESIGQSLPIMSASPGAVYHFDWQTGLVFEREISILGQLYLERAETLGRHRLNLSLGYQRVMIDTLNGADIGDLSDRRNPIRQRQGNEAFQFTIPKLSMALSVQQLTVGATYGITNRLDLNVTLPLLYSEFGLDATFRTPCFGGRRPCPQRLKPFRSMSRVLGPGDLLLRAKYLLRGGSPEVAMGLAVRVPTGEEENFQGTGDLTIRPLLVASTRTMRASSAINIQGHSNVGFDFDTANTDRSEARYGLGIDCAIAEHLTFGTAFLARHSFGRIAQDESFNVLRCVPNADRSCARITRLPLFGIENTRADVYDLSLGGRIAILQGRVMIFANAIVPLNRDGFRAQVIPLVGVEASL